MDDLAAYFRQTVAEEGIVGGAMLVVGRDSVLLRAFTGFADRDTRRAVDEATIFHWASITKTFTAIAVMQLRDRGRLSLDDPIVMYVPELRAVHNPHGSIEAITIRHLLSHSAGFRDPTWPWGGNKSWHPFEPTEWSQLVAMFPYTEVLFPPGSRYSYSNPGVVFLGETIHRLTGDDYEVYMDKNVLKPLGMFESYFDVTPYHLVKNRSNNYYVRNGDATANGLDFDTGITVSNGGLNAPLRDMAKYLRFLLGVGPATDPPIIARATLEEMWRPVLPGAQEETSQRAVGLGFFLVEAEGRRLIGHTGSQAGFRSFFYLDPEAAKAIIAVVNTAAAGDSKRPSTQRLFDGLIERFLKGGQADRRTGGSEDRS